MNARPGPGTKPPRRMPRASRFRLGPRASKFNRFSQLNRIYFKWQKVINSTSSSRFQNFQLQLTKTAVENPNLRLSYTGFPFFISYQGVSEELEGHHLPGHAASMDLNMHPSTSGNSCTISSDALLKIQIRLGCLYARILGLH
ncbi:uncharacterized protein LOC111399848 [Olea europaea var. sylvestris]|uniref:uncharacterized protein LOC111399848 n=1 Tax=Olea europaea var. sylvestris TaxID=158386 RepID=UPI000C1D17F6|nr:uncharacterized protein LOC111399848 [Olea europaea var. sylvestris]